MVYLETLDDYDSSGRNNHCCSAMCNEPSP